MFQTFIKLYNVHAYCNINFISYSTYYYLINVYVIGKTC